MDSVVKATIHAKAREWVEEEHLKNVLNGAWSVMFDSDGHVLKGIRGRAGAVGIKVDGTDIGVDCIEMQPGSTFLPHEHDGDHVLFFQSGRGSVHINGVDHPVRAGDTIFIPGDYPHAVTGPPGDDSEPLVIIAFGHPHKDVGARDRMKHPTHHHHHGHDHDHDH